MALSNSSSNSWTGTQECRLISPCWSSYDRTRFVTLLLPRTCGVKALHFSAEDEKELERRIVCRDRLRNLEQRSWTQLIHPTDFGNGGIHCASDLFIALLVSDKNLSSASSLTKNHYSPKFSFLQYRHLKDPIFPLLYCKPRTLRETLIIYSILQAHRSTFIWLQSSAARIVIFPWRKAWVAPPLQTNSFLYKYTPYPFCLICENFRSRWLDLSSPVSHLGGLKQTGCLRWEHRKLSLPVSLDARTTHCKDDDDEFQIGALSHQWRSSPAAACSWIQSRKVCTQHLPTSSKSTSCFNPLH